MNIIESLSQVLNKINGPISWTTYFASISLLVASRSPCERLKVGCVLVNNNNRILSTGYNGFLPGAEHKSIVLNNHEQATVHAEQNAISYAARFGVEINNSTAYVTHYPCINCCKMLIASGIKHIYYLEDYKNDSLVNTVAEQVDIKIEQLK